MNLTSKIYNKVICNNESYPTENEVMDEIICKVIEMYKDNPTSDELEPLEELLYSLVLTAEEYGFHLGIKFFVNLLEEIHSEA